MSTSEQRGSPSVPAPRRTVRRTVGVFIAALLAALAGFGVVILAATQPVLVARGNARAYADAETLKAHVTMLSRTFHPRDAAHPENLQLAANYIERQLRKASGRVSLQTFVVDGRPFHNVVARFGPDAGRMIVVGAHYDSAGDTPGDDDNAGGVAGLLELARQLADRELLQPVELVAFTFEEPPYFKTENMGSFRHAQALREERREGDYMISLEMIGMFSDAPGSQRYPHPLLRSYFPDEGNFIAIVGRLADIGVTRSLKSAMASHTELPVLSINSPREWLPIDLSDHLNYWDAGFAAVMVTDTAYYRNSKYHQATPRKRWTTDAWRWSSTRFFDLFQHEPVGQQVRRSEGRQRLEQSEPIARVGRPLSTTLPTLRLVPATVPYWPGA